MKNIPLNYCINNLKSIVFIFIISFNLSFSTFAQKAKPKEDEDIVAVSNDFIKNEKAILIKWFATDFVPKEGYNVYRKLANGGTWQKITNEPVKLMQTIPANLNIDSDEKPYWEGAKKIKPSDISKAGMLIGYSYIKAINSYDFALLMGMAYTDNSVEAGQEYVYMVKTIKNGKEVMVDSSSVIKQAPYEPEKGISKIGFERKKKQIELKFKIEQHRYYAIDVERKPAVGGEFKKRTAVPTLIQREENGDFPESPVIDKPIHKDTAYIYLVYGINYFGKRTKPSGEILVPKKDFDPPMPVEDVQYDADTLNVKLTWKPATEKDDDLAGYHVYRSLHYDKDFEKVTPALLKLDQLKFTDKVPAPGDYYYMVVSVDKGENESTAAAVMANVKDVVAPAIPLNFKAVADAGKVKLSWKYNTEKDLKGYIIYKALVGSNLYVSVNGDPFKDSVYTENLPKQVKNRFKYKIQTVDSTYNKSKFSDSVIVQMPDVNPPASINIHDIEIVDKKGLKIEWHKGVDNDLAKYALYRIDENNKEKTPVLITDKILPKEVEYVDITAKAHQNYNYFIIALDSAGNKSEPSNYFPFKWVDNKSLLKIKDFNVKLDKKDKSATLNWDIEKDANFHGSVVFRAFNGGDFSQLSGNLKENLQYLDKNLKVGEYVYLIKLYDKIGNITKSENIKIILKADENE